jgi:hypothetical protein
MPCRCRPSLYPPAAGVISNVSKVNDTNARSGTSQSSSQEKRTSRRRMRYLSCSLSSSAEVATGLAFCFEAKVSFGELIIDRDQNTHAANTLAGRLCLLWCWRSVGLGLGGALLRRLRRGRRWRRRRADLTVLRFNVLHDVSHCAENVKWCDAF